MIPKRKTAIKIDLKKQIGQKSKVKGHARDNAMIVHGDPDKIEIANLKRQLANEKASYSELKGELGLVRTKLLKEKRMRSYQRMFQRSLNTKKKMYLTPNQIWAWQKLMKSYLPKLKSLANINLF